MRLRSVPQSYDQMLHHLQRLTHQPRELLQARLHPLLIAPYQLELETGILEQIQTFAKNLQSHLTQKAPVKAEGFSASVDAHWDPLQKQLKIIEHNTNAAFLGLSIPLYRAHQITSQFQEAELLALWPRYIRIPNPGPIQTPLFIVDHNPHEQNLYLEFLLYQNLFNSIGYQCQIQDSRNFSPPPNALIYNRLTDFYLQETENQGLALFFKQYPDQISPNPSQYDQFANKIRLEQWQNQPQLAPFLLKSFALTPDNADIIWSQRKEYFFKPQDSFGSKATARGSSISRKRFSEMVASQQALAQQFLPAPEIESPEHGPLKFDLRFYYSQGEIIQSVARLYQGQVTNARTPGGGFAPIVWN